MQTHRAVSIHISYGWLDAAIISSFQEEDEDDEEEKTKKEEKKKLCGSFQCLPLQPWETKLVDQWDVYRN